MALAPRSPVVRRLEAPRNASPVSALRRTAWPAAVICTAVAVASACGNLLGPEGFRCAQSDGIEICTEGEEYRPGSTLVFDLTNLRSESVWVDLCSIAKEVADRSDQYWVEIVYSPNRRCGFNPGPEVLAQNRPEVEPGGTLTHSIVVHSVVQAVYRLDVWLLDEAGNFLSDDPFQSGKFAMFPSAGQ